MSARVLVVDDVPLNAKLLEAKLRVEYFEVETAVDGVEALERAAASPPDIVLLDVMMPRMDGFEACRRLKADPRLCHIPVVMVTALHDMEHRVRGLESGADDFLTKPVDDLALFARVRSLTRLKRLIDEWRVREATSQRLGLASPEASLADEPGDAASVAYVGPWGQEAKEIVEQDGHTLNIVSTPQDVLALVASAACETAMLELTADGADVLRFCTQLRAHETTRHLPVLLIGTKNDMPKLAKGLELGATDYIYAPWDKNELHARLRTQVRRFRFQKRLQANHEASLELAVKDALTGLYNRHYLSMHMRELFSRTTERDKPLALIMIDADHFKAVNDVHGHAAGDAVLCEIARRLETGVRTHDFVARLGGEEFIVVMPNADSEEARSVAERLRRRISRRQVPISEDAGLDITVSMGIGFREAGDRSFELMLNRADEALYDAKAAGRDCIRIIPPGSSASTEIAASSC